MVDNRWTVSCVLETALLVGLALVLLAIWLPIELVTGKARRHVLRREACRG